MTAPTTSRTTPLRARALAYLRDGRVTVQAADGIAAGGGPSFVAATVCRAPGDPTGHSTSAGITFEAGAWSCSEHRDRDVCAHRLAVQLVTGHARYAGRSRA